MNLIIENDNKEIARVEHKDILIYTIDNFNSRDIFINIELEFYKSLLIGKTVGEAEQNMIKLENSYIKRYKNLKYISLPLLFNKMNRKIIGDRNSSLSNVVGIP
jgi:hypothetical protein